MPISYPTTSTISIGGTGGTSYRLDSWATSNSSATIYIGPSPLDIGDEVFITSSWPDNRIVNFSSSMHGYTNNGLSYKIINKRIKEDGIVYQLDNSYWWYGDSLTLVDDKDIDHPNRVVIRKVKAMQRKRKENGYAF